MKVIIFLLALMVCWVSCAPTTQGTTTTPFVKLSCSGHNPNGFFVDSKDPHIFHQCSHGQHVATFHCQPKTIFNETAQVCVTEHGHVDHECPKPDGMFPYPGNAHKFILCNAGRSFVETCAADLIFDETKGECIYNDNGVTWPSDPTTTKTPPTTASPATVATETENPTTMAVASTVSSAPCVEKEHLADPDDKTKYFVCHGGKMLHVACPDGLVYDQPSKTCN